MGTITFANGEMLEFTLERKRIKRINLRIRRDGSIYVSAPYGTPLATIEAFISEQRAFIRRARDRMFPLPPLQEGSTVFYLGQPYRLRVMTGKRSLVFADGVAALTLPKLAENLEEEYERALCAVFLPVVTMRCQMLERQFPRFLGKVKEIRVRVLKSMWGSCRPAEGRVTFSASLASMPMTIIDNVVAHEYTHFYARGHGEDFYRRFAEISPEHAVLDKELTFLSREQKKQR